MKSVWVSLLCFTVLVATWGFYDNYSDRKLHVFIGEIEKTIIPAVESDGWGMAESEFDKISDSWHKYKKSATFFFDRQILNEADYSIAKSKYYIRSKDISNATGELACLVEQLTFLHSNEQFCIENIL